MLTVNKDFLRIVFFIYGFAYQMISEKTLCSKILPAIKDILFENKCDYNSNKFSYKFIFIPFLFKKEEQSFRQVCGLVTTKISVLSHNESCSAFESHAQFNRLL